MSDTPREKMLAHVRDLMKFSCEHETPKATIRMMAEYIPKLEEELAAAQAKIDERLREIDRLDCTVREGGQTLHCPVDNQCLRCRFNSAQAKIAKLEAQHERMKCALRTIYLDDIFDDTMRSIAAEALKNG